MLVKQKDCSLNEQTFIAPKASPIMIIYTIIYDLMLQLAKAIINLN